MEKNVRKVGENVLVKSEFETDLEGGVRGYGTPPPNCRIQIPLNYIMQSS